MNKTEPATKTWSKPELVKLGALKDVAGANAINANGASVNPLDPAVS